MKVLKIIIDLNECGVRGNPGRAVNRELISMSGTESQLICLSIVRVDKAKL